MNTRKRKLNLKIESDSSSDSEYEFQRKIAKSTRNTNIKEEKQDIKTEFTRNFKTEDNEIPSTSQKDKLPKTHVKEELIYSLSDSSSDNNYVPSIKKETLKVKKEKDSKKAKLQIKQNNINTKDDKQNSSLVNENQWQSYELLSEYQNLDLNVSQNIIKLFDAGCTIPFIARYRKDVTNNMTPEVLREVKENYDKINTLKSRAQTVLNCLEKSGNLDNNLKKCILGAKTIEEVEHIVRH